MCLYKCGYWFSQYSWKSEVKFLFMTFFKICTNYIWFSRLVETPTSMYGCHAFLFLFSWWRQPLVWCLLPSSDNIYCVIHHFYYILCRMNHFFFSNIFYFDLFKKKIIYEFREHKITRVGFYVCGSGSKTTLFWRVNMIFLGVCKHELLFYF